MWKILRKWFSPLALSHCIICSACIAGAADTPGSGREWADAGKNFKVESILAAWPEGTRHEREFIAMRDGIRLVTEIIIPPGGKPFPTVLLRTPYGRQQAVRYANQYKAGDCVFVAQDSRGRGDSEGKIGLANENEIEDSYDTIDWISKQSWSNGRVGVTGGSGHGVCARMAFLSRHPALVISAGANTAGNTYLYWSFENGVRRWMHGWCHSFRNVPRTKLVPTLPPEYDLGNWRDILAAAAEDNRTVLFLDDGWYNCFGDGGAIDDFIAFAGSCRVYGTVDAKSHQGRKMKFGLNFPYARKPEGHQPPSFLEILKGAEVEFPSRLQYYLMGDVSDPEAPGKEWRSTDTWPPAGFKPEKFYLHADGSVSKSPPIANSASLNYRYDPKDPAPSRGGGYTYAGKSEEDSAGALDQRPLHERKDILRFYSEPLEQALEITGKLAAELYFTTDVEDTTLIVKLIDVYPDGYEMIVREGAAMARYRGGLDKPSPLRPGEVAKLAFEFNSTAIVFNKGHRIGVFVTSSSVPAYEPHPNVYQPVNSYDQAKIAEIKLQMDADNPSSVVLPVRR